MNTFSALTKLISDSKLSAPNPFAGDDRVGRASNSGAPVGQKRTETHRVVSKMVRPGFRPGSRFSKFVSFKIDELSKLRSLFRCNNQLLRFSACLLDHLEKTKEVSCPTLLPLPEPIHVQIHRFLGTDKTCEYFLTLRT